MTQISELLTINLQKYIANFCRRIAYPGSVISICLCGIHELGVSREKTLEVLTVIKSFKPKLMSYIKLFDNVTVIVYAVDKQVFEKDIESVFLGEATAFHLIFPYTPLLNAEYLASQELKLKRRLTLELLENLVLEFPELSYDIHIKPEYFMYEAMLDRARLFPPLYHMLSSFSCGNTTTENMKKVMKGYVYALTSLEEEKIIERENGYIKISKKFIDTVKSRKINFKNLLKATQKTLFMSFLGLFPNIFKTLSHSESILSVRQLNTEKLKNTYAFGDPKRFLFIPTANGLISLSNNITIENFAKNLLSANANTNVTIKKIGGVLNDVYLV
ncbi:MAG: hypothetical protein QXR63_07145, partial [Candidatus Bathyarchaeia archaeon]